jgi:hypothetical protein
MGHPRSVVASADSGFLSELSARFGMTKVFVGFAARLKSCSRGASKIIRGTGSWNPTLRKVREGWGTLGPWSRRLTTDSSPGFQPGSE